jgi:hypothetical protein
MSTDRISNNSSERFDNDKNSILDDIRYVFGLNITITKGRQQYIISQSVFTLYTFLKDANLLEGELVDNLIRILKGEYSDIDDATDLELGRIKEKVSELHRTKTSYILNEIKYSDIQFTNAINNILMSSYYDSYLRESYLHPSNNTSSTSSTSSVAIANPPVPKPSNNSASSVASASSKKPKSKSQKMSFEELQAYIDSQSTAPKPPAEKMMPQEKEEPIKSVSNSENEKFDLNCNKILEIDMNKFQNSFEKSLRGYSYFDINKGSIDIKFRKDKTLNTNPPIVSELNKKYILSSNNNGTNRNTYFITIQSQILNFEPKLNDLFDIINGRDLKKVQKWLVNNVYSEKREGRQGYTLAGLLLGNTIISPKKIECLACKTMLNGYDVTELGQTLNETYRTKDIDDNQCIRKLGLLRTSQCHTYNNHKSVLVANNILLKLQKAGLCIGIRAKSSKTTGSNDYSEDKHGKRAENQINFEWDMGCSEIEMLLDNRRKEYEMIPINLNENKIMINGDEYNVSMMNKILQAINTSNDHNRDRTAITNVISLQSHNMFTNVMLRLVPQDEIDSLLSDGSADMKIFNKCIQILGANTFKNNFSTDSMNEIRQIISGDGTDKTYRILTVINDLSVRKYGMPNLAEVKQLTQTEIRDRIIKQIADNSNVKNISSFHILSHLFYAMGCQKFMTTTLYTNIIKRKTIEQIVNGVKNKINYDHHIETLFTALEHVVRKVQASNAEIMRYRATFHDKFAEVINEIIRESPHFNEISNIRRIANIDIRNLAQTIANEPNSKRNVIEKMSSFVRLTNITYPDIVHTGMIEACVSCIKNNCEPQMEQCINMIVDEINRYSLTDEHVERISINLKNASNKRPIGTIDYTNKEDNKYLSVPIVGLANSNHPCDRFLGDYIKMNPNPYPMPRSTLDEECVCITESQEPYIREMYDLLLDMNNFKHLRTIGPIPYFIDDNYNYGFVPRKLMGQNMVASMTHELRLLDHNKSMGQLIRIYPQESHALIVKFVLYMMEKDDIDETKERRIREAEQKEQKARQQQKIDVETAKKINTDIRATIKERLIELSVRTTLINHDINGETITNLKDLNISLEMSVGQIKRIETTIVNTRRREKIDDATKARVNELETALTQYKNLVTTSKQLYDRQPSPVVYEVGEKHTHEEAMKTRFKNMVSEQLK